MRIYKKLIKHLDIHASEFLMIGNSLKSDILPLVAIGAPAIHIPFHTTWVHEEVSIKENSMIEYKTITNLKEILDIL